MPIIGVVAIVAGTAVTQIEAAGMAAAITAAGTVVVVSTDTVAAIMAMAVVTDTINKHYIA
jgi:tRNA A37 threonylcarbamoyladenosine synthetase subunit TsaC/SUA5/YrdC